MRISRRTALKTGLATMTGGLTMPFIARTGLAAPAHTLKLVYADTVSHPINPVCQRFADNVKKKTNGDVEVQVFTVGQLGTQVNMLTGLQTGIIDLCAHTSGFVQTLYPKFMVVDLPFLFSDLEKGHNMMDGAIGTQLMSELPAKGVYGLTYGWWGWRVVETVDRAIVEPDAMRGLKIRVQPGAIYAALFTTLGATPVQIDLAEVYMALSQRTVEAVELPMISVVANKYDEVVKVINRTNHVYNVGLLMASKRKFDTIDKKYQAALREAAIEMKPDWRQTIAQASSVAEQSFAAKGLKVVDVNRADYRKALEPVYQQYRKTIGADLVDSVLKAAS
jgi:tripartite ATP-independent transporter DctP family solute receptor